MSLNDVRAIFGGMVKEHMRECNIREIPFLRANGIPRETFRNIILGRYEITKSENRQMFFRVALAISANDRGFRQQLFLILKTMCFIREGRKFRQKRLGRRRLNCTRDLQRLSKISKRF